MHSPDPEPRVPSPACSSAVLAGPPPPLPARPLPDFCLFPGNREGRGEGGRATSRLRSFPPGRPRPSGKTLDQGNHWQSVEYQGPRPRSRAPHPRSTLVAQAWDRPGPPRSRAGGGGLQSCKELSGCSGPGRARLEPRRPRTPELASLRPPGASRPPAAARRTPRGRRGGAGQPPRQEARLAPSSRACLLPSAPSRLLPAFLPPPPPPGSFFPCSPSEPGAREAGGAARGGASSLARSPTARPAQLSAAAPVAAAAAAAGVSEGAQDGRAGLAALRVPGGLGAPSRRALVRRAGGCGALGAADPALRVSA